MRRRPSFLKRAIDGVILGLLLCLAVWAIVGLYTEPDHGAECLCAQCEAQYDADWEADHAELLQK